MQACAPYLVPRIPWLLTHGNLCNLLSQWYGWKDFDVCESGTFMKDMPAYQEYLVGLRAEVASLVAKLAFINKYRLPRQSEVEQGMPRM